MMYCSLCVMLLAQFLAMQTSVAAAGVWTNWPFTLNSPGNVTAADDAGTKTLTLTGETLTGDTSGNSLTVSVQPGLLKFEGASDTTLNHINSVTVNHTGQRILNRNLGDGDDSLALVGIDSSTTNVNLGPGADKVAFSLCNLVTRTVDGGSGTDIVSLISSTI
jgi:hypothetical protein